jgi:hypothetical protein
MCVCMYVCMHPCVREGQTSLSYVHVCMYVLYVCIVLYVCMYVCMHPCVRGGQTSLSYVMAYRVTALAYKALLMSYVH